MTDELTKKDIINLLAEQIGVGKEDIHLEDTFTEHLHMNPSDVSDLIKNLETKGVETDSLDLPQIKTVQDLLEALGIEENQNEEPKPDQKNI